MQLKTFYRNWFLRLCLLISYDDLEELVVYLWWKIHRDGDTLRLIKWKIFRWRFFRKHTKKIWKKLRDDYLDFFGVSPRYEKYLKLLAQLQDHTSKLARTGNRWHVGQIMIIEEKLDMIENEETPNNEYDTLMAVRMTTGLSIDPKKDSVIEYGSIEKKAIEISKKQESDNRARKAKTRRNGR